MLARVVLIVAVSMLLASASEVFAKKPRPADPPPDQTTDKDKNDDNDKPNDKTDKDAVETHKARAKEMENGKPLDKAKTAEGIDKITSQVNALDAKLKDQDAASKDPQATKGKRGRPATQPTTQPTTKESTTTGKDKERDDTPPTTTSRKKRTTN